MADEIINGLIQRQIDAAFDRYEKTIAAERERCARVVLDCAEKHPRTGRLLRMLANKIRKGE
jgi:hypothetical protein